MTTEPGLSDCDQETLDLLRLSSTHPLARDRVDRVRAVMVARNNAEAQIADYENRICWDTTCGNCAQPEPAADPVAWLPRHLAYISHTVTASYPEGMADELVMRRRVGKIFVEAGELGDAIEGYTGENPRKGFYATADDVIKELIDCASAALCAVEFMTGDKGNALGMLAEQVKGNAQRLSESIPDHCADVSGAGGVS